MDYPLFGVLDMSISHPDREVAEVNLGLFIFIAITAPVAIIAIVFTYLCPGAERSSRPVWASMWQRKLCELDAGLPGLGISLATATIILTAVKNLTGKPHPDFLEQCQPSFDHIADHTVEDMANRFCPSEFSRSESDVSRVCDEVSSNLGIPRLVKRRRTGKA